MRPTDLIDQARFLAKRSPRKPRLADLCRAQSAAYYALFHKLCFLCAGSLLGVTSAAQQQKKWVSLYRKLDHRDAKKCCQNLKSIEAISPDLAGPAQLFVALQEKRHSSDYDPAYRPRKSVVLYDIEQAALAIVQIDTLPEVKRREFALFLLYKQE